MAGDKKTYKPSYTAPYEHPDDARVLVVSCMADFEEAARGPEYEAVIYERSQAYKDVLKLGFEKALAGSGTGFNTKIDVHIKGDTVQYWWNMRDAEIVRSELETMARVYNRITGETVLGSFITKNMKIAGKAHSHETPFINSTPLGKSTIWQSPSGKTLEAGTGNLFYFERGFRHGSPEPDGAPRVTLVAGPRYEIFKN